MMSGRPSGQICSRKSPSIQVRTGHVWACKWRKRITLNDILTDAGRSHLFVFETAGVFSLLLCNLLVSKCESSICTIFFIFIVVKYYINEHKKLIHLGYWHQRAVERHGNSSQGNLELLVVTDKVTHKWARGKQVHGMWYISLQCLDTVGWATGMASGLQKVGCWFVGGDDLTGALHDL